MAEIRFFNDMFNDKYITQVYDNSKSLTEYISQYAPTQDTENFVECYDSETGETYYTSCESSSEECNILICVNNVTVGLDYEIKEKDIVNVIFLPTGDNIGAILGAAAGVFLGVVLIATGVGAPLGGFTLASGLSLIGGLASLGAMIGTAIQSAVEGSSTHESTSGKQSEKRPDVRGSSNASLLGSSYPFVFGKHLITPRVVGDPYTYYEGEKGEDAYIKVLYCAGYGPLKLTDFKFADQFLAYNRSHGTISKKTVLNGLLKGYSTETHDDGDIIDVWENNDIELEIIQHDGSSDEIHSTIYDHAIFQEKINAPSLFVADESLEDAAKVTYKNLSFPKNFRTNTVIFTEGCPREFTIVLDAPNGLYEARNKTERDGNDSKTSVEYNKIPLYFCIQYRPYNKNNESPASDGSDINEWIDITTWNGKKCGSTFTKAQAEEDIERHRGNVLSLDVYDGFVDSTFIPIFPDWMFPSIFGRNFVNFEKFSGEDFVSQTRLSATVELSKEFCKEYILNEENTMKAIEIRVLRVSPSYIDEKKSSSDSDNKTNYGPASYSDLINVSLLATKTFDEKELRDNDNFVYKPVQSQKDFKNHAYIAIKAKADNVGNIENQIEMFNCMAESFSPIWEAEQKKWLPEGVKRLVKYYGYGEKVLTQPEDWSRNYNNYLVLSGSTFVKNTNKNFGSNIYKAVDRNSEVVEREVTKEMYEEQRRLGVSWYQFNCGSNYPEKIKKEVFSTPEEKNGQKVNYLKSGAEKYNETLSSSGFMLACVGPQNGIKAFGYDEIDTLSVADWNEDIKHLSDGYKDDDGNLTYIRMESNGYIYEGVKLSELLKSIAMTGRAIFTYDELGKIKVIMDKETDYPDGTLNSQNIEDITVQFNYAEPPAGLRISFSDENDGYTQNSLYCWSDGNEINNYKGQVQNHNIPYVTNPQQCWSLGRYFFACYLLNKELATIKANIRGGLYSIGDVVAVQSSELLIGDDSGRIQEVLIKNDLIYGVVLDSTYEYTGNTVLINGANFSEQGVSILQPKQFGNSKLVTLRIATVNTSVLIGNKTYTQKKGITNLVLFDTPVPYSESNDPSIKEGIVYNFKTGDICMFGLFEKIYSKYKIIKLKPNNDGSVSYSAINYEPKIYNYGAKLPILQKNITPPKIIQDSFNISDVPISISEINKKLAETSDLVFEQENAIPRNVQEVLIVASKDGLEFIHNEDKEMYFYGLVVEISKGNDNWAEVSLSGNIYYFNRNTDGFPEKEELDNWKVRIKAQNIFNKTSDSWTEFSINTTNYKGWKPSEINVYEPEATEDGFIVNWNIAKQTYGNSYFYVSVYNGESEVKSGRVTNQTYKYFFNRVVDGYPEKENYPDTKNLRDYRVIVEHCNEVYHTGSGTLSLETKLNLNHYKTWIPSKPVIKNIPVARKDGFVIDWDVQDDYYGSKQYFVEVFDGDEFIFQSKTLANNTFEYVFDRNVDGYPEKETYQNQRNLRNYKIYVTSINEVYRSDNGAKSDVMTLNVDSYGTWQLGTLSEENVSKEVLDRTVMLRLTTPSIGLEYYGKTEFRISIKRVGIDLQDETNVPVCEEDAYWYKPNLFSNPYADELGYRTDDVDGFVTSSGSYHQTLPLFGQQEKNAINTVYGFKVVATNEVMESNEFVFYETALCSALRDIVIANENFKKLYVGTLSAIVANVGLINKGGFGDFNKLSTNYWALSQLQPQDTGINRVIHEGEFRVGDSNSYIKVSFDERDSAVVEFKTDAFTVSSLSAEFSRELIITENSNALERTRITPSGTFFEARKTPAQDWKLIAKMDATGVLTPTYMAEHQIIVSNASQGQLRSFRHDIGRSFLSSNGKVWHFDENEYSQNETSDGLVINGDERRLVGFEDNTSTLNFTPAILREAPYSFLSKSLYGLFQLSYTLPNVTEYTVEFWQQYIYNEGQILFTIGTQSDEVSLQVKPAEPVFCESGVAQWVDKKGNYVYTSTRNPYINSLIYTTYDDADAGITSELTVEAIQRGNDGEVVSIEFDSTTYTFFSGDADYNWEIFAPQDNWTAENVIYNITATGDTDLTHFNQTQKETISLFDKGFQFSQGQWYHIGIILSETKLNVVINETVFEFSRYGSVSGDCLIKIGTQTNTSLIDELYIDTIAEDVSEFKNATIKRVPFGALDTNVDWFIFDAKDPSNVKSNILEYFKEQLLSSEEFKNAVKNVN